MSSMRVRSGSAGVDCSCAVAPQGDTTSSTAATTTLVKIDHTAAAYYRRRTKLVQRFIPGPFALTTKNWRKTGDQEIRRSFLKKKRLLNSSSSCRNAGDRACY